MTRFAALRETFDEAGYLDANADVKQAVATGAFLSGFDHFVECGFRENRAGVDKGLSAELVKHIEALDGKIILAGHSHINAIVGYRSCPVPEIRSVGKHANVFALDGPWPRDEAYWQRLHALAGNNTIAVAWGGNEYNTYYFFEENNVFDFLSPHVEKLIPGAQIVPQSMIKKKFAPNIHYLAEELRALVRAQPRQIIVLGTPPPKKDNAELASLLAGEAYFQEYMEKPGDVKIADPYKRLKLWHLWQDMVASEAARVKGRFVSVPSEAQDEEGFLKRELWANDVTHGNEAYGQMMMRKLIAVAGA